MTKKKFQKESEDAISKVKTQYRKKCEMNNVPANKTIRDKLELASESGQMKLLQLSQTIGPVVLRSIMDSLVDAQYGGLKILRLWRVSSEDEGVRVICNYINKMFSIEQLNLLQNGITSLGCEFLCKTLLQPKCSLIKLKLDGNPIKSQGLKILTDGLKFNNKLLKLSLRNCQIDSRGGRLIQTFLANINSNIISLRICQNPLGTQGLSQIINVLKYNDKLSQFKCRNVGVQFLSSFLGIEQKLLLTSFKQLMRTNKTITYYDFRFNPLTDTLAQQFISIVEQNKLIQECKISQTMDIQLKIKLKTIIDSRVTKKPKGKINVQKQK